MAADVVLPQVLEEFLLWTAREGVKLGGKAVSAQLGTLDVDFKALTVEQRSWFSSRLMLITFPTLNFD